MSDARSKVTPRRPDLVLKKMREICLKLPEAVETATWGQPNFRVNDKIFAGCGQEDGESLLSFKLEKVRAAFVVLRPGFRPSKYGGNAGWVSVQTKIIDNWEEIAEMIRESYRLIAPKRSSKLLTSESMDEEQPAAAKTKSARKTTKRSKS